MSQFLNKIKYLIVLLIACNQISQAQQKFADDLKVMVNYHTGLILPEYPFFTYIVNDYVHSLDVCLIKETNGKNMWEQLYNYPGYGISLFYSTLGNDKILGREIALNYFFIMNIISKGNFRLYNRTGFGLGYISRKFDINNNYLDVAVGSNINIHFNLRFGINYSLSNKIDLNAGLSFDHFSNANTSAPNLGVNYVTSYGGLSYTIGQKLEKEKHEYEPHIRKNNVEIFASIGGKYTREMSTSYYMTSSVSLELTREYFRTFYLGTGLDMFYDSSVKEQLESKGEAFKSSDNFQTGIHISQEFVYNRASIIVQEGIYLYQVNQKLIYNRAIFKYRITDNLLIRVAMKSHLHILDYPEFGIGYKF